MTRSIVASLALTLTVALGAPSARAADAGWIQESNRYAQELLEVNARYGPEGAASLGVEGHDTEVLDLKPQFFERQIADLQAAAQKLESARGPVEVLIVDKLEKPTLD